MRHQAAKGAFGFGEPKGLRAINSSLIVAGHKDELAVVRHQDQSVLPPIPLDLFAVRRCEGVVVPALRFDDAAFGRRASHQEIIGRALGLLGRVESEIRLARPRVLDLRDASDPGLEGFADFVEQRFERAVVGFLARAAAG